MLTTFGDTGVDDAENALGWFSVFEVMEVKDESRFKVGLISKVAKVSSNEVGLTGSTCVAAPFVTGKVVCC